MKKWVLGISTVGMLVMSSPSAFASEALQSRHSEASMAHGDVQAVTMDPGEARDAGAAHHWDVHSSVQVSRETLRDAFQAGRDAYTHKLQKYAKCSPGEAKKAVLAAHPKMKVETLQLRNIRTNLVYMAIAADDENKYMVIVDAGNGKVLLDRPLPTHHERVFAGE
ncbi:PepSY domain-containing protein [Alicyclobacillus tolerans]|uniref:PepSY domain-containing protein n=1 Tax=Alicyclobacillus tolerans TaxID=90970 RepID=UPI001F2C98BC|nr:PepSY domain-containing protein [Alicyclobacillus tolerans]MCF8564980.1 PepSY domain-containing protein [Alicyclobacillus tolerans]